MLTMRGKYSEIMIITRDPKSFAIPGITDSFPESCRPESGECLPSCSNSSKVMSTRCPIMSRVLPIHTPEDTSSLKYIWIKINQYGILDFEDVPSKFAHKELCFNTSGIHSSFVIKKIMFGSSQSPIIKN